MRINSIQNYNSTNHSIPKRAALKESAPTQQVEPKLQPSFKGNGTGALIGIGAGLCSGLALIGIALISGGLAIPAYIAGMGVAGTGVAGGYVGDKIEDKFTKNKNK